MPTDTVADILDLRAAWPHVREEMKRSSLVLAFERELILQDEEAWLQGLESMLADGMYHPSVSLVSELPKRLGLVRPLTYLVPVDRLVYAAAVRACFPAIERAVGWAQGTVDFAHRLGSVATGEEWIRSRYVGWDEFRSASLAHLDDGVPYVVFTDLAAFYEHIDIALLVSDLNAQGAPRLVTQQLRACLERWAQIPGRGLPQGHQASDILSKLYLNVIDRYFAAQNVQHVRYSDDIRIFCHNRNDAQAALVDLSRLARSQVASCGVARDRRRRQRSGCGGELFDVVVLGHGRGLARRG